MYASRNSNRTGRLYWFRAAYKQACKWLLPWRPHTMSSDEYFDMIVPECSQILEQYSHQLLWWRYLDIHFYWSRVWRSNSRRRLWHRTHISFWHLTALCQEMTCASPDLWSSRLQGCNPSASISTTKKTACYSVSILRRRPWIPPVSPDFIAF